MSIEAHTSHDPFNLFWFCLLGGRNQYANLDLLVQSAISTRKIRSNQGSDTAKHLIRNRLSCEFMEIFFLFEGKQNYTLVHSILYCQACSRYFGLE